MYVYKIRLDLWAVPRGISFSMRPAPPQKYCICHAHGSYAQRSPYALFFFFPGKLQLRLPVNRFHTHFLFIIIFISLARYYPAPPPPPPSRSAFFVFHAINARIFCNKYRSFLPASVNFFFLSVLYLHIGL